MYKYEFETIINCVAECPFGTVPNESTYECIACDSGCLEGC